MRSSLQPYVLQADIEDEALRYLRFADMAAASRARDVARSAAARRNGGNTTATLGRPAAASRLWKVVRPTPLPHPSPPLPAPPRSALPARSPHACLPLPPPPPHPLR
jgi:hypothetical protein